MCKLRFFCLYGVLLIFAFRAAGNEIVWNSQKGFDGWKQYANVTCKSGKNGLIITEIQADPQIVSGALNIDPSKYDRISITYRATGTQNSSGEIFYAHKNMNFSGRKLWRLPALISDGKWHTVILTEKNLPNPVSWFEGGAISRLRLDPVNLAGGKIEISEIKLFTSAHRKISQNPIWNKENNFAGWKNVNNCEIRKENGLMQIKILGNDPQLLCDSLNIDAALYSKISIRYRAKGVGNSRGEFYYAHQGVNFSHRKKWVIPQLISDGAWHTLILEKKDLTDPESWFENGTVSALRFDPTNSGTGTVEISEIKFLDEEGNDKNPLPPKPKLTTQLDGTAWHRQITEFKNLSSPRYEGAYFTGKMIKSPDDKRENGKYDTFFLRREIFLKDKPVQAWIQYCADDKAAAFVNGTQTAASANWRMVEVAEVTSELNKGKNVWGFRYNNFRSAGGVMAELFIRYADETFERFVTDGKFTSSVTGSGNWSSVGFNASAWTPVIEQSGPPHPPWRVRLDYKDFSVSQHLISADARPRTVRAGSTVKLKFNFRGRPAAEGFQAKIVLRNHGNVVWEESVSIKKSDIKVRSKNVWSIDFDYTLPLYLSSNDLTARLETPALFCKSGGFPEAAIRLEEIGYDPEFGKNTVVTVAKTDYGPHVLINGKPTYLTWGITPFDPHPLGQPRFGDAPLNVVTVNMVNHDTYFWPSDGVINTAAFDWQAELYRRLNPGAWFIFDLILNLPHEWGKKHPDDLCRDEKGEVTTDGPLNYSFSSPAARKAMEEAMVKAINYLENSPYANRIIGYRINSGHTIEWLGWEVKPGRAVDFSPVSQKSFNKFAKEKYGIENASVPVHAQRMANDNGRLLWDPAKHLNVIAFNDFYSNQVADTLIYLCSKAKSLVKNRKLIVTYYGYTATLHASGNSQLRAHYALKKVLDSQAVDILLSPPGYATREHAGTLGDMKPFASIKDAGIIPALEDDTRTHNGLKLEMYSRQTLNEQHTLDIITRNLGIALCRNMPSYLLPLANGTDFDFPSMAELITKVRKTGEFCIKKQTPRKAEIAIVFSEKSIISQPVPAKSEQTEMDQMYKLDGSVLTFRRGGPVLTWESFVTNATRFARIGAPVDYLLAENLEQDKGEYKLYIFLNCFTYDDKMLAAVRKLQQKKTTLLWVYAPGYTHGTKNSTANMKQLTGIDFAESELEILPGAKLKDGRWMGGRTTRIAPTFYVTAPGMEVLGVDETGKAGIAAVKTGKSLSVFSNAYQFDVPFLQNIARRAGVHIFSESGDPMEANDHLFSMHTRFKGKKVIKLPRKTTVLDVINRRIVAENVSEFTFDARLFSSWIFYYGDDARELLNNLKQK